MLFRSLLVLLIFFGLLACGGNEAGTGEDAATVVPPGPITLRGGKVSLTVDPNYGARITSLKYDGREILRTERDEEGFTFGSTVWTSPQSDWKWPPPAPIDSEPYSVTKLRENVYIFRSAFDSLSELRMEKRVQVTDAGDVGLRYRVMNESGAPVGVAAWEVTRLPYAGRIEFSVSDTIWSDVDFLPVRITDGVGVITFDDEYEDRVKVFATLRDTAVRYYNDSLVFTKQTMITGGNQVAEGQAPLEVYFDPKRGFVEFELQGGYYALEPGQEAEMRVKWTVHRE